MGVCGDDKGGGGGRGVREALRERPTKHHVNNCRAGQVLDN